MAKRPKSKPRTRRATTPGSTRPTARVTSPSPPARGKAPHRPIRRVAETEHTLAPPLASVESEAHEPVAPPRVERRAQEPAEPPPPDLQLDHERVRVSEVLAGLSLALDLTEGQAFGHTLRSCLIAARIGEMLDLPLQDRRDLYYASLLKDAGCSSGAARLHQLLGGDDRAAKQGLRRVDWANYLTAARYAIAHTVPGGSWFARALQVIAAANLGVTAARELAETRCTRGAAIATQLGFGPGVAAAIASLDEHWDGHGQPRGLAGREVPMLSRIMGLAQTLETFAALEGATRAIAEAKRRRGTWFDPALVLAVEHLEAEIDQLCQFDEQDLHVAVLTAEPGDASVLAGPTTLDRIARAFAAVVDGKSPYTAKHSVRVARISELVAEELSYPERDRDKLRRAALLHDLGKLSVSNTILDKPGLLSSQEWDAVRLHPYYTQRILSRIPGLGTLAFVASSHHERLDGRGYFRGLRAGQLPLGARILAVADTYEALTADRPHRPALPEETALRIMERDRDIGLDGNCLDALVRAVEAGRNTEAEQDAA